MGIRPMNEECFNTDCDDYSHLSEYGCRFKDADNRFCMGFISKEDYEKLPKWSDGTIFDYTP